MQLLEYAAILRRRWFYVALGLVVGLVAGYVTAPGASGQVDLYQATHQLLVDTNSTSAQGLNLEQTELIVNNGAVPQRVAARLAEQGLPAVTRVVAKANPELHALDITAYSTTAQAAATAADLLAQELNAELVAADQSSLDQSLAAARERVGSLQAQILAVDLQLAPLDPEDPNRVTLEDQRRSFASSLGEAQAEVQSLEANPAIVAPLRTLEAAKGRPAVTDGWKIPESKAARSAMLGLFGLILGIAGALAADRLDTRVRNKQDAEWSFDLPVIAEIPPLPSGTKGRELLVATRPSSPFVESYRALRTVVLFAADSKSGLDRLEPGESGASRDGSAIAPPPLAAQVLLMTSPSAGEGKTTSVAHLAAVLAEFGKRVLVVSADFRRPRVHELFGVPREPGLSDVLDSGTHTTRLSDLQMITTYRGVHLLPSGAPVNNPARLLTETRQLINAARSLFDFVIIDTPPLLVANDATELAAVADMVILLAKADRTSREAARRSTEMLRRVEAPILGVVVVAAHDTPTAYGYYRYRYYAEADQGGGGRFGRRKAKKPLAGVGAASSFDED